MSCWHIVELSAQIPWRNITLTWKERYVRQFFVVSIMMSLGLTSMLPVVFTGFLSQLNYLVAVWPWLRYLNDVPKSIQRLLWGVLPPLLLGGVILIVPAIL